MYKNFGLIYLKNEFNNQYNIMKIKHLTRFLLLIFFFSFFSGIAVAQHQTTKVITIEGVVKDETGVLPGVNVSTEDVKTGTITDNNGRFNLTVSIMAKNLIFSYIGKETKTIPINGKTEINVMLNDNAVALNEVVAIGYGYQKKSDLTGAISSVKMKDVNTSAELNITKAIQGKATGVNVIGNSGSPGSGITVRIRGTGTVNNSDPLYIVDEQPVLGIEYLNPGDIESVEILKDASASAIYGSKAANGVIVITTKKGKIGKPVVSFDAYTGVQSYVNKLELCNATEYAKLRNLARFNSGIQVPEYDLRDPESLGEGTDWWDLSFRNASIQNCNLGVSGGSDKFIYSLIGNLFSQDGIIKKTDYKRQTLRLNTEYKLSKFVKLSQNFSINNTKRHWVAEGDEINSHMSYTLRMDPVTLSQNPDGTYSESKFAGVWHPLANLDYNTNREWNLLRLVGNIALDVNFLKDFYLKVNYGFDQSRHDTQDFYPSYNMGTLFVTPNSFLINYYDKYNTWTLFNTLSYVKKINEHSINAMLGIQTQEDYHKLIGATKLGDAVNSPNLRYFDSFSGGATAFGNAFERSILSYFGRAFYNYKDKYLFTGTYRIDGSSKFASGHKYGHFPSASLSWNVNNESFMKKSPFSSLKMRLGWGMVGNQEIPDYTFATFVNGGQNYVTGTGQVVNAGNSPISIGNDIIKWETTIQKNLGIDFGFINNKISGSLELYDRQTLGMLLQVPIPGISGVIPPFSNAGNVSNKGIELNISYKENIGQFRMENTLNFSHNKNLVTGLGGGEPIYGANFFLLGYITRTEQGHSIAEFYGWKTNGIFQNQAEVDNYKSANGTVIQPYASPGDFKFMDLNEDGVIDEKDKTYIGSPHPLFTAGYTLNASYSIFDLNVSLNMVYGNKIFNGINRYLLNPLGDSNSSKTYYEGYWRGEGTSNTLPRPIQSDPNQNYRLSDRYVEDGSYLRVQNIELGVNVPSKLLSKIKVDKCRLYLSAQNFFTFTKYSGIDPELGIGKNGSLDIGIDKSTYPYAKTLIIGTKFTF